LLDLELIADRVLVNDVNDGIDDLGLHLLIEIEDHLCTIRI
jgi:hypothetical protein